MKNIVKIIKRLGLVKFFLNCQKAVQNTDDVYSLHSHRDSLEEKCCLRTIVSDSGKTINKVSQKGPRDTSVIGTNLYLVDSSAYFVILTGNSRFSSASSFRRRYWQIGSRSRISHCNIPDQTASLTPEASRSVTIKFRQSAKQDK